MAFYDGDPAAGGTLIDMPALPGPLVGGSQSEVSTIWLVPPSTEPRDIYVVIDPSGVQEDRDPAQQHRGNAGPRARPDN